MGWGMDSNNSEKLIQDEGGIKITHTQKGMKWYLFLIWGFLIYMVISSLICGIDMFKSAASVSEDTPDKTKIVVRIYNIFGALMIVYSLYVIYTRKLLVEFKVWALYAINVTFFTPVIILVAFFLTFSWVYEFKMLDLLKYMIMLDEGVLMIDILILYLTLSICSIVYLRKRKHMFIY